MAVYDAIFKSFSIFIENMVCTMCKAEKMEENTTLLANRKKWRQINYLVPCCIEEITIIGRAIRFYCKKIWQHIKQISHYQGEVAFRKNFYLNKKVKKIHLI